MYLLAHGQGITISLNILERKNAWEYITGPKNWAKVHEAKAIKTEVCSPCGKGRMETPKHLRVRMRITYRVKERKEDNGKGNQEQRRVRDNIKAYKSELKQPQRAARSPIHDH